MQTVAQGGTITLRVTYQYATGELLDPMDHHIDIVAPDGSLVVNNDPSVRDDLGEYHYSFTVDPQAAIGTWTAKWYGTYNGQTITSAEEFAVAAMGSSTTTADIVRRLRRLIGERIPIGKDETATRFTDAEISDTYYANSEDLNKSLAELWLAKAAALGDYVDMSESGTVRNLSQMARAAMAQATKYENRVQVYETAWQATYRVPGRTFHPYGHQFGRSRLAGTLIIFAETQRAW